MKYQDEHGKTEYLHIGENEEEDTGLQKISCKRTSETDLANCIRILNSLVWSHKIKIKMTDDYRAIIEPVHMTYGAKCRYQPEKKEKKRIETVEANVLRRAIKVSGTHIYYRNKKVHKKNTHSDRKNRN